MLGLLPHLNHSQVQLLFLFCAEPALATRKLGRFQLHLVAIKCQDLWVGSQQKWPVRTIPTHRTLEVGRSLRFLRSFEPVQPVAEMMKDQQPLGTTGHWYGKLTPPARTQSSSSISGKLSAKVPLADTTMAKTGNCIKKCSPLLKHLVQFCPSGTGSSQVLSKSFKQVGSRRTSVRSQTS